MHSIPSSIRNEVDKDFKPYVVAYHFKLDPDVVKSWDNDAILKAFYTIKRMGVIK